MTREDIKDKIYSILWDKFTPNRRGKWEIDNAVDEIAELFPLPPAEGAEEILRKIVGIEKSGFKRDFAWFSEAIAAMHEFATLHAQRIADKMVSERLREELTLYHRWIQKNKYTNIKHSHHECAVEYLQIRDK